MSRAIKVALATYAGLFLVKFGAYLHTGLLVLLAESFETLTDLVISAFFLLALSYGRRPASERHPFGHRRVENVAALTASVVFLTVIVVEIARQAIPRLFTSSPAPNEPAVGAALLIFSMVAVLIPLKAARDEAGASGSKLLKAQSLEVVSDILSSFAALSGILLTMSGYPLADPIFSLLVAAFIVYKSGQLYRENLIELIGRSPGKDFMDRVRAESLKVGGVRDVHCLRGEYVGAGEVHLDMHMETDPSKTVQEAHRLETEVRRRIKAGLNVRYLNIHLCDGHDRDEDEAHG